MTIQEEIELIYQDYPNKEGKKRGMTTLKNAITNRETLERFKKAFSNYIDLCHREDRVSRGFVKMWSTFANNWEDYVDVSNMKTTKGSNKTLMELVDNDEI